MTIAKPGRRLMHDVPLKFVQKRVAGGGHRSTNANLSLTSMIDFLVLDSRRAESAGLLHA